MDKQIRIALPEKMVNKIGDDMKSRSEYIQKTLEFYWSQSKEPRESKESREKINKKNGGVSVDAVNNDNRGNRDPIVWRIPDSRIIVSESGAAGKSLARGG